MIGLRFLCRLCIKRSVCTVKACVPPASFARQERTSPKARASMLHRSLLKSYTSASASVQRSGHLQSGWHHALLHTSMHCKQHSSGLPHSAAAIGPQQAERADVRVSSLSDAAESFIAAAQRPKKFKRHGITGDGSCMFRACVQGHHQLQHGGQSLDSTQEFGKALELRRAIVDELRNSREEIEPFLPGIADDFEDYLRQMSQPGVWGGEPELLMASRVLKRPICVYEATWSGPQYLLTYGEDLLKSTPPMHLLWSGAHYDLLLPHLDSKL